jgi:LmbE family N-acetylglucosaminyl deacetylase
MAKVPGPIYYLAPHADDVVMSCAGSLLADVRAGREVTLITVFLSGAQAAMRRAEDEAAARALGCRYLSLDLFDAPDRPEVRGALGLFMPFGPEHLGITSEVVERLRWHIGPGASLRAPLGVGGHIDHRIVHEAARALAYDLHLELGYYEDLPYGLARYALGRRLAALEVPLAERGLPGCERASAAEELRALREFQRGLPLRSWEGKPGFLGWLPGRRWLGAMIVARSIHAADQGGQRPGFPPRLVAELRAVPAEVPERLQALAAYASQWPIFAASPQALLQRLVDHGAALSAQPAPPGQAWERLWLDQGVRPSPRSPSPGAPENESRNDPSPLGEAG